MQKLIKTATVLTAAAILAGCVSVPTAPTIFLNSEFDEALASSKMQKGDATVTGTAFLKQRGGGIVTCAGNDVTLIPATDYAAERLKHIYGAAPKTGEVRFGNPRFNAIFSPNYETYQQHAHKAVCDAQGNFEFKNIQLGRYYVTTHVAWQAGGLQGGFLATQLHISDQDPPRIIISK